MRYGTEELVSLLAKSCREAYPLGPKETLAINHKLRAADRLAGAILDHVGKEWCGPGPDENLKQRLAEYEGAE